MNEKWVADEIMAIKKQGGGAHASTHGNSGADRVTLDTSQITSGILSLARLPVPFLYAIPPNANLTKSNCDANGVYLTYTWTLTTAVTGCPAKWESILASNYLTRTMIVYDSDKTTVLATYTFTRTIDADNNLITEVLSS